MDQSLTIHERNVQKLAIEVYKARNNLTVSFMETIFSLSKKLTRQERGRYMTQKIFAQFHTDQKLYHIGGQKRGH